MGKQNSTEEQYEKEHEDSSILISQYTPFPKVFCQNENVTDYLEVRN